MGSYNNFREPVEYIIKQYWRKKSLSIKDNGNYNSSDELPEYPFHIIRNSDKKAEKIIYAEGESLEWSEELVRDFRNKVVRIKVTLPKIEDEDPEQFYIDLVRNSEDKVEFGEVND